MNDLNMKINELKTELAKVIIWQDELVDALILSILSWGHIILEWVPGLAKTLSIQALSKALDLDFKRISFTPDLLPSDLLWWEIYNQHESKFYIKKWPIFTNFLLADEINRAPSKVQSALLEAMQEGKITIWEETFVLNKPFFVLATQNPIEQEWTYNLPEAQLDRFLFKVIVSYPNETEEIDIMKSSSDRNLNTIKSLLSGADLISIQEYIEKNIFVDEKIYEYIKDIVFATRFPWRYDLGNIWEFIWFWASPRASISLLKSSKAKAFLYWRDYVTPDDIKELAHLVLRHRIWLTFQALWENISTDSIISEILNKVIVP